MLWYFWECSTVWLQWKVMFGVCVFVVVVLEWAQKQHYFIQSCVHCAHQSTRRSRVSLTCASSFLSFIPKIWFISINLASESTTKKKSTSSKKWNGLIDNTVMWLDSPHPRIICLNISWHHINNKPAKKVFFFFN